MQPDPDARRRLALLVATSVYSDPDLRELRTPGRDAAELSQVLGDPRIGGFEVQTLVNAPSGEVQEGIEDFCADRHPDDQLLIYVSCHGVLDSNGRLYYTAVNTRRQRLAATAIAATWLTERLDDSRARGQIVVLDCCHSGAFARGAKGDQELALEQLFEPHGRGRVVLTASRSTEYSFEGGQVSGEGVPSVFTHAIVTGLRTGEADRDKDGLITVTDLYQYVYDHVRAAEPRQTPGISTYGAEGSLLVARSVRGPVIEPEPLPEDLRVTLESPRRRVREMGIAELADLLDGAGPGLALAARQALERIAQEDHPQVAALARIGVDAPAGAAADQVRRELTERAQREERARREAEEQARREAEEQARREAEEQARREAEEQARQAHSTTEATRVSATPSIPSEPKPSGSPPGPGETQPAATSSAQPPPASQRPQSGSSLPTAVPLPEDVGARASSVSDLPRPDSEQSRPQPGQRSAEHRPETVEASGAEAAQDDGSASGEAAAGHKQLPAGSQRGLAREIAGTLRRWSSSPLVWAAGSAVLGVLLFAAALTQFSTSSNTLWSIILSMAIIGALLTAFERPVKRLGTLVQGWNFIWSICIASYFLDRNDSVFAHETVNQIIASLNRIQTQTTAYLVVGAVGNAICAAVGLVLIARGNRSSLNVTLSITTGLITVGLLFIALGTAHFSTLHLQAGGAVLFAASLASLAASVVVLARRSRSRTDSHA